LKRRSWKIGVRIDRETLIQRESATAQNQFTEFTEEKPLCPPSLGHHSFSQLIGVIYKIIRYVRHDYPYNQDVIKIGLKQLF
jgi:hypothetical protein